MTVTTSLPLPRMVVNLSRAPEATVLETVWTFAGSFQSLWTELPLSPCCKMAPRPLDCPGVCTAALGLGAGVT